MPPESSATPTPRYGMPINFYYGQKPPEQYNANGAVRPVSQTGPIGPGGPVPTGQTGLGVLVAYQSSAEPIASIPPVQTDFSPTNRFTGYCVPPYATMAYNPYTMSPRVQVFHTVQRQIMVICSKHHIHNRTMHRKCRIILVLMFKGQMTLILIKYLRSIKKIWLLCLRNFLA